MAAAQTDAAWRRVWGEHRSGLGVRLWSMEGRDPYRVLHVHTEADPDVIKAAYRVLARKLHPDGRARSALDAAAERRMAELNWAYGVLRDAEARAAYDRERRYGGPAYAGPV